MTHREEGVVVCDEGFQRREDLVAAFDAAITGDSRIDEGVVRPFFAETAVQEEEQVQDRCRRVDEFLFVFPIEEGNRPVFPVVGDVSQGRPAVVQSGGVETGQALAGFFKGSWRTSAYSASLATPCRVLPAASMTKKSSSRRTSFGARRRRALTVMIL